MSIQDKDLEKKLLLITVLCGSRKNKYPTHGRSLEIPKRRVVIKANILEAKRKAKLDFLGGGDAKQKPSVGGVWIFSGTAHLPALL